MGNVQTAIGMDVTDLLLPVDRLTKQIGFSRSVILNGRDKEVRLNSLGNRFPLAGHRLLAKCLLWLCCAAPLYGEEGRDRWSSMLAKLEQRVRDDPSHSDSWRLIAKIRHQRGNHDAAIDALNRALAADPENVAAHFDLGQILESQGDTTTASRHYSTVCTLAPQSRYAERLREQGFVAESAIRPVGYEIKTFDGSEAFLRQLEAIEAEAEPPTSRWRAFVETGVLYNSNVSLTPISRQLDNRDASSLQGFLNPEVEWNWIDRPSIRTGPISRGYFAVNEQQQSDFDLAAFQGGWFLERDTFLLNRDWISRLDYLYSLDLQGGSRFADRHSWTLSATSISPEGDLLYLYGTFSLSDFANDGIDPDIDSLDGPGFIAGVTRYVQLDFASLKKLRVGADLSAADTEGADYRFIGAGIHGGLTLALRKRLFLEPEFGLGYRNYDDFTGVVSRDEILWRLAARLERQVTDHLSLALVIGYDRFASDNQDFDAERTEGGVVLNWIY